MRRLQDLVRRRGAQRRWRVPLAALLFGCGESPATVITPPPPAPDPTPYLWPDSSTLLPGMTRPLKAETFTADAGIAQVTATSWTSSDPGTASVNASGVVTAHTAGHATITAVRGQNTIRAEIFVIAHPEPLRFTALSVGFGQTCGVTTAAAVYCWGELAIGLGAGPVDRCEGVSVNPNASERYTWGAWRCSAIPRRIGVAPAVRFREVHVGGFVLCALTESDEAHCWNGASVTPFPFATPPLATMSSGDTYACGIGKDGLGYCWGEDFNGRLGNGPGRAASATPQRVLSDENLMAVSAQYGSCALTTAGDPLCWGQAPLNGTIPAMEPGCDFPCTQVPQAVARDARYTDVRFTSVVARLGFGCGLTAAGEVYCWGGNALTDVRAIAMIPAVEQPSPGVSSIRAAFSGPIVAIAKDGTAYSVGYRQTGPADSAFAFAAMATPMPMKFLSATSATAGCGIGVDDIAYCWGYFGHRHGNGTFDGTTQATSPARVAGQ